MRECKIYACESCDYKCEDAKEMEKHEAAHLGLTVKDAKEIAKNTDGGEFIESGVGDWEYDYTEDENGNLIEAAY